MLKALGKLLCLMNMFLLKYLQDIQESLTQGTPDSLEIFRKVFSA